MQITLNGKNIEVAEEITLAGLIEEKGLEQEKVLASVNKTVIERGGYAQIILNENDSVEVFKFVSGG
jgi:sulfur carrier protein